MQYTEEMTKHIKKEKILPHIFDELRGEVVSILMDHHRPHSNLKESYVGILMGRRDGFVCLGLDLNGENRLKNIYIREDQVLSIWVYS